jgi:anti-anti-sigma regulatory factor
MSKIENRSDGRDAILRLSGRIESEHLEELKAQIESARRHRIVLDLEELKLVDRAVVRFFGLCESNGIEVRHCAPYIREWIFREKVRDGHGAGPWI